MRQAGPLSQLIAVTRTFTTFPPRNKTNPRRPHRFFQASPEFLNERISSPGCIAPISSDARSPSRRPTASGDDRRELIQLDGSVSCRITDRRSAAGRALDHLSNDEDRDARTVRCNGWLSGSRAATSSFRLAQRSYRPSVERSRDCELHLIDRWRVGLEIRPHSVCESG